MKVSISAVVTFSFIILFLCGSKVPAQEKMMVATLRYERDLTSANPAKLSPALVATRDSEGILKGADDRGRPVISVATANIPKLTASRAVLSADETVPSNWKPVTRLKVSYTPAEKPTNADLEKIGLRKVEDYDKGSFMLVEPFNERIDAQLARLLAENPKIRYVTPSFNIQSVPRPNERKDDKEINRTQNRPALSTGKSQSVPTDKLYARLWGMQDIRAPQAWQKLSKSPTVVVSVIDTGIDYQHPDLQSNMWKSTVGRYGCDFVDNDDDPMDGDGHGTHCAGTIGAVKDATGVVGVTWEVKIMACRWLDNNGSGNVVNAIKCIDFAIDNGANVLSNSWYWPEDDFDLEAAIKRANDKGVLFVAAAANFRGLPGNNDGDNDNVTTTGRYPSCYAIANVISVAAVDDRDYLADFSNWGKKSVDLGAPGVGIVSSVLRGQGSAAVDPSRDYDSYNGTSMATPHVAGAAALAYEYLRATIPAARPVDAKTAIIKNVRMAPDLQNRCKSNGVLDMSFIK